MEQIKEKDSIKIKLKYPIPGKVEGEEITKIRLHRLKAKHLHLLPKNMDKDKITPADMLPLIAAMADLDLKIIEEIDFADIINITKKATDFFDISQEIGED